jgi:hypothetical protein
MGYEILIKVKDVDHFKMYLEALHKTEERR